MSLDSRLNATVDKIVSNTESTMISKLDESLSSSKKLLLESKDTIEREYDRIMDEGNKEADKIHKQIVGSSNIKARNAQLVVIEDAINDVFDKASEKIRSTTSNPDLIKSLVEESIKVLGTSEIIVSTNSQDQDVVKSAISGIKGVEVDPQTIECLGGIKARSKDGNMAFDNTTDAQFARMKPLLRKEISEQIKLG